MLQNSMHVQYETPVRRRSGYNVIPSAPDDAPSHGSTLLKSICSTLGGWVQDQPEQAAAELEVSTNSNDSGQAHSLVQVLEEMGSWALQAAALNICLPSSGWLKLGQVSQSGSRCDSSSPASRHPTHPPPSDPSNRSGSDCDLAGSTAGRDTRKPAGQPDYCKTPQHSSSTAQQTPAEPVSAPVTPAVDESTSRIAELTAGRERMQCELTCLRTTFGALYITCSTLKAENQRLRVAADAANEELLSDALEQLLGEKNALQQEVAKLKQHNKALQELLEFTAPAAAPSASEGLSWAHGAYDGGSSSNRLALSAATRPAAHSGGSMSNSWQSHDQQVMQSGYSHDGGNLIIPTTFSLPVNRLQPGQCLQQVLVDDVHEACDYWLATPAGSVAGSSTDEGLKGKESPDVSSRWAASDGTGGQEITADSTPAPGVELPPKAGPHDQLHATARDQSPTSVGVDEAVVQLASSDMRHQQCSPQQLSPGRSAQPGRLVWKKQQLLLGGSAGKVAGLARTAAGGAEAQTLLASLDL